MKKITFLLLMLGFSSFVSAQCFNADDFGQYPTLTYTPETCDGVTVNEIADNCYAGEYSAVEVVEGQTYVFSSSIATDFLTISADEGVTAEAFGEGSVTWVSTVSGEIWFYTHTDAACGESDEDRSRNIVCGIPSADAPDYVSLQWPQTANFTEGGSVDVYGQVYEGGLTDVAPNIDGQAPGIQMWVGISPEGENTDPSTWTTWIESTFNAGHISNNDEYMAAIGADLEPGTYYYATRFRLNTGAYVYGGINASNNGNFWNGTEYNSGVLTIDALPTPDNDVCVSATAIAEFPYSFEQTDGSASTNNDGFITTCSDGMNDGLWYSFVGDGNDITVTITPADDFDPQLAVYSGDCGALICEGTIDEGGSGGEEEVTVSASEVGVTYYVNVGFYSAFTDGDEGNFTIDVISEEAAPVPVNDACATATTINSFPYSFEQTDGEDATNNDGVITTCSNGMNDGLWYTVVGDGNDITITITPDAGFDPQLGIYSGDCGALVCEDTIDDGGDGGEESYTIVASSIGTTYYINIGHYDGFADDDEGNFTIDVTSEVPPPAPANDACVDATVITDLPYVFEQTDGAGATNNDGYITGCPDAMNDGVWYTVVGDGTNLTINITPDETFDPQIGVYTGTCGAFECVGTADLGFFAGDPETYIIVASEVGTTYYINVGFWGDDEFGGDEPEGSFTIEVASSPVDELPECASNPFPPDGAVDVPTGDIVFTWEASSTGGTPTSYDFYGGTTTPLTEDDFIGNFLTTSADITITGYDLLLFWKVVPRNLTGEAEGCVEWSFTTESAPEPPVNDACANATVIATPYSFEQTDGVGATNNDGFDTVCTDAMNDGVWYTVAGDGGDITINILPEASYDPQVNFYSGSCGDFTCLGTADSGLEGEAETFTIEGSEIGTNYYINIGYWSASTDGAEGNFTIDVTSTVLGTPSFDTSNFKVYPNPVTDVLNLSYTENMTNVEIFNLLGQRVVAKSINANKSEVDMSSLSAGTYLVKVMSDTEFTTIKVIKQ